MARKLFIVDPALRDFRGHHYQLSEACANAAVGRVDEVIWLTHKDFVAPPELADAYLIRPTFSENTYTTYNVGPEKKMSLKVENSASSTLKRGLVERVVFKVIRLITHFLKRVFGGMEEQPLNSNDLKEKPVMSLRPEQELYRGLFEFEIAGNDIVFFHTCDRETYKMIADFFSRSAIVDQWSKLPVFHISTPYDEAIMPHNKKAEGFSNFLRRLKSIGVLDKRVFLYAENDLLAAHLSKYTGFNFESLPVPSFEVGAGEVFKKPNRLINVTYFGAARTEKGFCIIPDVVEKALSLELSVRFTIQASPQIMGYTPDVKESLGKLKLIDSDNLKILYESQSPEDYKKNIGESNIILLCYDKERYRVRGSGIAVESVVNEVSIISLEGTFPSHMSKKSGVSVSKLDVDEIVGAIKEISENFEQYLVLAKERKSEYISENNAESFIKKLTSKGRVVNSPLKESFPKFKDETRWKPLL